MAGRRETDRAGRRFARVDIGIRPFVIRRQNLIYVTLMAIGLHYIARSMLGETALASDGVAFILVGGVGLIMSFTTVDIGHSLKEAIHEEGVETRAAIADLGRRMEARDKRIDARLAAMDKRMEARDKRMEARDKRMEARDKRMEARLAAMDERMEARDKRMEARLAAMDERMEARLAAMDERMEARDKRMDARLEQMSTTVETISKDNRIFFKQILDAQNRILEKVS